MIILKHLFIMKIHIFEINKISGPIFSKIILIFILIIVNQIKKRNLFQFIIRIFILLYSFSIKFGMLCEKGVKKGGGDIGGGGGGGGAVEWLVVEGGGVGGGGGGGGGGGELFIF